MGIWCVLYQIFDSTWQIHGSWWCHDMEKLSALMALCAGNSSITVELSCLIYCIPEQAVNKPSAELCNINILTTRQNSPHFVADIFKLIFLDKNYCILINVCYKWNLFPRVQLQWSLISWDNGLVAKKHGPCAWATRQLTIGCWCVCRLALSYYVVKFYEWSTWYFGGNQMASYHAPPVIG